MKAACTQDSTMKKKETPDYKLHTADIVTLLRVAGTILLAVMRPLTAGFFWVYTLTGVSDVLDGWIARKTKTASDFGARLDSIADLLFYAVMLLRLFPVLWKALPVQIWYTVAAILLLRLSAYCTAAIKYHRFACLHTWMNKLTGGAVFLLPYMLVVSSGVEYSWALCALAGAASLEELLIHLCRERYEANTKSILQKKIERKK